jgi:dTDP-4-amino-4,6-dideoxygalactose transaminase
MNKMSRRNFVHKTAITSAAIAASPTLISAQSKPALLGGAPVRAKDWADWPEWRREWEAKILDVMRSGRWWRGSGGHVADFEKEYAELIGAKSCLATASGTAALLVSLHVHGVDAGDEVLVSPYTFIASYNSILLSKALPVFVDTDPKTFTLDPQDIESKITERTTAIMPVHIYGIPCDMDPINTIAQKHNLAVVEDACQAWLAEYKGTKCGVLGDLGCFSFQNSKHLPTGEGGAITGMDAHLIDRCSAFHNCGRGVGSFSGDKQYFTRGSNRRMQQVSAAMLIQQIAKLKKETEIRQSNAAYLAEKLSTVPGIQSAKRPQDSKAVWHLFPVLYDAAQFNDLPREQFVRALRAEGIPSSTGYHEQYFDGLLDEAINSRGYKRLYSEQRLNEYRASLHELKGNKKVCENVVAFSQNLLLGEKKDMDDIINAIVKVQKFSNELKNA